MLKPPKHPFQPLILVEFLDVLDGQFFIMEPGFEALQDGDILGAIESSPPRPLHRPNEREPGLPEPEHVLRHANLIGRFRNGAKGVGALGQLPLDLLGQGAIHPRLHDLGRTEADHATGLDRGGLAGLGIASHAGPLGPNLEDAKSGKLDLLTAFKGLSGQFKGTLNKLGRVLTCKADLFMHCFTQISPRNCRALHHSPFWSKLRATDELIVASGQRLLTIP